LRTDVRELGGEVDGVVHGSGEDVSAFEDGEDVVGEGGQIDGDRRGCSRAASLSLSSITIGKHRRFYRSGVEAWLQDLRA
jgi:hypothetical protein